MAKKKQKQDEKSLEQSAGAPKLPTASVKQGQNYILRNAETGEVLKNKPFRRRTDGKPYRDYLNTSNGTVNNGPWHIARSTSHPRGSSF